MIDADSVKHIEFTFTPIGRFFSIFTFLIVIDVPILNGVDGVHFTFNKEGRPSGECFIEVATEADRDL